MGTKPLERVQELDLWRIRGLAVLGLTTALYAVEGVPGRPPSFYLPLERYVRENPGILPQATLLLCFLNYRVFGSVLRRVNQTPELSTRWWWRAGRFILFGIPLFGTYILSLGRWTAEKSPFGFLATFGQSQTPPAQILLSGSFLFTLQFNLFLFQGWIAYLDTLVTGNSLIFTLSALGIVTTQVDLLVCYRRAMISGRRGFILLLLSVFWLLPFHLGILAGTGHFLLLNTAPRPRHWMKTFFKGRLGLHERLEESVRIDWWRASRWRLWRASSWTTDPAADHDDAEKLVPLYGLKTFLAIFEAMGVILLLFAAGQRSPVLRSVLAPALAVIVILSFGIAALGFLVLVVSYLTRFFGRSLVPTQSHGGVKYLTLSLTSMLVGTYISFYLLLKDLPRLGLLLIGSGGLAAFATFFLVIPFLQPSRERVKKHDTRLMIWFGIFATGAAAGVAIRANEAFAYYFKLMMLLMLALTPIVGLGVGLNLWSRLRPLLPPRPSLALRSVFAFCLLTAFLPLGGFAVPLWILFRKRLVTALSSSLAITAQTPSPEENVACKLLPGRALTWELRNYFFSNEVSHLAVAGEKMKTYKLLERTSFLRDQLTHFGGFGKSSDDIETHIVPMAIEGRDWSRFIHFMMLAFHLRGTVEDLPELIEQLARSGQVPLALDAANRIADPLNRVGAKAALAKQLSPDSETYQALLQSLPHDLASLPPLPADPTLAGPMEEKQYWTSIVIAQAFGMAAREPLAQFLIDRPVWWSDVVWISMAQCQAERYGHLDSELWRALRNVQNPTVLKGYLPEQLAAFEGLPDPEAFLACVERLSDDQELSWLCRFKFLALIAKTSIEQAVTLWQRWDSERPVYWSVQVAEMAAPFLSRLKSQQIQNLIHNAGDPEVKIALLLAVPPPEGSIQRLEETGRSIENLPEGMRRIHWQIRFLGMRARSLNLSEIQAEITGLAESLNELEHKVEAADLCRFFELIAAHFPEKLNGEMKGAFWAPSTTLDALVEIADTTESAALLAHLLEKMDHYILPFRPGEAEGFQLWSGLLQKIVPRLCAITNNISHLERAVELNPDQGDELRATAVKELLKAKAPELVEKVCDSIRSPRLRRLTRLKILADSSPEALKPASMFEAFAASEMVQDVVLGLQALAASSGTPYHLLHTQVSRVQDQQEQFLAFLRIVERALSRTKKVDRHGDLLDRFARAAGLVTSDVQFSALAPEITAVVVPHSGRLIVTEVREALECLISLRSVPWPVRRDTCETLLSRLLPLLTQRARSGRWEAAEVARMIADLLKWIGYGDDEEIEERGILPALFATMDRLPLEVLKPFLRELPLEGLFPELYVSDERELAELLDRMIEKDYSHPLVLETMLYLFSSRLPDIVPEILDDLTAGPIRDVLAASLLRHGWLPAEFAPEVLPLIENTSVRMSTELALGLHCKAASKEEETWLYTLASLSFHQLVDPTDPRNEPWLRKLWTIDPERSRPVLAWGALRALSQAGRWHGMSALCLWLHAHLALDAGNDPAQVLALCSEAEAAVQRASILSPVVSPSTNA